MNKLIYLRKNKNYYDLLIFYLFLSQNSDLLSLKKMINNIIFVNKFYFLINFRIIFNF